MRGLILSVALGSTLLMGQAASAVTGVFEGFENPAFVSGQPGNWQGSVTRVTTGTHGDGVAHAELGAGGGQYTTFGGYTSSFDGGFVYSLDIYLDPADFSNEMGFDYTTAVSKQNGDHLRDFMFHVGMVGTDLLVNASNNTDNDFNSFKLLNENGGSNYTVNTAGWYTFEQVYRDNGAGILAVDMNLYDDSASLLYSVTRSTPSDDIASVVGGTRYAWFTYNDINGLGIDNSSLSALSSGGTPTPEPATAAMGLLGMAGLAVAARRRRA